MLKLENEIIPTETLRDYIDTTVDSYLMDMLSTHDSRFQYQTNEWNRHGTAVDLEPVSGPFGLGWLYSDPRVYLGYFSEHIRTLFRPAHEEGFHSIKLGEGSATDCEGVKFDQEE